MICLMSWGFGDFFVFFYLENKIKSRIVIFYILLIFLIISFLIKKFIVELNDNKFFFFVIFVIYYICFVYCNNVGKLSML